MSFITFLTKRHTKIKKFDYSQTFDVGQIYIGNDGSWYVLKQEESLAVRNPYLLVSLVK